MGYRSMHRRVERLEEDARLQQARVTKQEYPVILTLEERQQKIVDFVRQYLPAEQIAQLESATPMEVIEWATQVYDELKRHPCP